MLINRNIFSLFFLLLFLSCSKDDSNPAPPSAPENAPLSGEVILSDEGTNLLDKSGMRVSLDSTFPPYSSVTDANGKFSIPFVPFGKRTLVYEKSGYGTYKMFNIEQTYNNGIGTVITTVPNLGKISTTKVTSVVTAVAAGVVTITVTSDPGGTDATPKYLRMFFGPRTAVSNTNFQKALEIETSKINPFIKTLTKAELNTMGFASGTTVYVRVYGDSFRSNTYDDPVVGRTIFPNLNPSTVAASSFIVP